MQAPQPPPRRNGAEDYYPPRNNVSILVLNEKVKFSIRVKSYDTFELSFSSKDSTTLVTSTRIITLDKLVKLLFHPPKGVL